MSEYAGFCTMELSGPTEWGGGDVMGYLLAKEPDGWYACGSHYSSSPGFSKGDILRQFNDRKHLGDTYVWHGQLTTDQVDELLPAGHHAAASAETATEGSEHELRD